jgi:apolipoprotein N-acyltransferase
MPFPGLQYYLFAAVFGLPLIVPYAVDRFCAGRLGTRSALLGFPASWVALEYVLSLTPGATWGATAYSQYGNLPLLQILSVTGPWSITFLIGWFATSCNRLWQEGIASRQARRGLAVFACVLATVLLLGGARLAMFPPWAATVRIASLSRQRFGTGPSTAAWQHLLHNEPNRADLEEFHRWSDAVNQDLLARADREAQAGARIVFWGEGNAWTFKEDEQALIDRGKQLSRKRDIYLGMALSTWSRGLARPRENKIALISPSGDVAWQYWKSCPVPGAESLTVRGDGKLHFLDTRYGRISSAICYDVDFPGLIRQAGALDAAILLDPADDWRGIDPLHTHMASFRALEQGVNLVRQTSGGLSAAFDYQGRVLAAMDHYQTDDHVMIAQVPTAGVRTFYSRTGDWFAWFCCGTVLVLAGRAFHRGRRSQMRGSAP